MKELIELIHKLDEEKYVKFSNDYNIYSEEIERLDHQLKEIKRFVNGLTSKEVKGVKKDLVNY